MLLPPVYNVVLMSKGIPPNKAAHRVNLKRERFALVFGSNKNLSVDDLMRIQRQAEARLFWSDQPCSSCGQKATKMYDVGVHDEVMRLCETCCQELEIGDG